MSNAVKETSIATPELQHHWQWEAPKGCDITPSWVGGDGEFTEGTGADGTRVLRRRFTDESCAYASPLEDVVAIMSTAGEAGLTPTVMESSGHEVVMKQKPASWRSAKLDDLCNPVIAHAALRTRRAVHGLPLSNATQAALCTRSLIEDVAIMRERCVTAGISLPRDADRLLAELAPFTARADEFHMSAVLCHGDGAASNVLINAPAGSGCPTGAEGGAPAGTPESAPLLTGWTVSGMRDPLEEAGSVISELFPFCGLTEQQVLRGLGLPTDVPAVLSAQAYAVLDGVFWGLIGLWRSTINADKSVDCAKYGLWRLVKARHQLDLFATLTTWLEA